MMGNVCKLMVRSLARACKVDNRSNQQHCANVIKWVCMWEERSVEGTTTGLLISLTFNWFTKGYLSMAAEILKTGI